MANMHKVNVGKVLVNTRVITTVAQLDESLSEMLSIARLNPLQRVVGLDIEKKFTPHRVIKTLVVETVATLMLCCGYTCLIIKLSDMTGPSASCSISRFLQLEELTFVGIRMQYCIEALENSYWIKCRNAFELNERATRTDKQFLQEYRLIDFAYKAPGVQTFLTIDEAERICNATALSDWGADTLSQQQITAATLRAFLCFYVANYLREGYVTRQRFWEQPYDYDLVAEFYKLSL